jgi:hypothetical protein
MLLSLKSATTSSCFRHRILCYLIPVTNRQRNSLNLFSCSVCVQLLFCSDEHSLVLFQIASGIIVSNFRPPGKFGSSRYYIRGKDKAGNVCFSF